MGQACLGGSTAHDDNETYGISGGVKGGKPVRHSTHSTACSPLFLCSKSLLFVDTLQVSRKVVVIGDGACGKTSLLHVYVHGHFPQVYEPTVFENMASLWFLKSGLPANTLND